MGLAVSELCPVSEYDGGAEPDDWTAVRRKGQNKQPEQEVREMLARFELTGLEKHRPSAVVRRSAAESCSGAYLLV